MNFYQKICGKITGHARRKNVDVPNFHTEGLGERHSLPSQASVCLTCNHQVSITHPTRRERIRYDTRELTAGDCAASFERFIMNVEAFIPGVTNIYSDINIVGKRRIYWTINDGKYCTELPMEVHKIDQTNWVTPSWRTAWDTVGEDIMDILYYDYNGEEGKANTHRRYLERAKDIDCSKHKDSRPWSLDGARDRGFENQKPRGGGVQEWY